MRRQRIKLLGAVAALLCAAACSSGGSGGGHSTTGGGASGGADGGSSGSSGVDYAKAQLSKYSAVPTFTAPGPAFDVTSLRGKSMFVVPATSNDFDNAIEAQMKAIARKYGVKYTEYNNQGSPAEWASGLNAALSQKPDLIVLNTALDPRQVAAQMKQAKAAHIPVLATHFFDEGYAESLKTACGGTADLCDSGLTATVNAPFNAATRVEADQVIADSNGKGHVMVITANDAAPTAGMVDAAKDEFARHCPDCKVDVKNISIAEWATKIQPEVQTALTRDPQLKYIMPLFDYGASFAASGINAAGKAGQASIVSYNGTQNVLALMQKGNLVKLDVGESLNWLGYAFMDQAFRVMAGQPPVSQHTPVRAFTKDNVGELGTPPNIAKGYGDSYVQGYTALWKTS
jgi:ribose transport system substrate-binding protein